MVLVHDSLHLAPVPRQLLDNQKGVDGVRKKLFPPRVGRVRVEPLVVGQEAAQPDEPLLLAGQVPRHGADDLALRRQEVLHVRHGGEHLGADCPRQDGQEQKARE